MNSPATKSTSSSPHSQQLQYRNALAALAHEGLEGPEAEELAVYAARINCSRYDGTRGSTKFDPRLSRRWMEVAPETARRYGYDTDPSGLPDQNHAVIALGALEE